MARTVRATVQPLSNVSLSGRCVAHLDPALMRELGLAAGDMMMVDGGRGRPVLVRLGASEGHPDGQRSVGLDRWVRRAGQFRSGSVVELVPCPQAGPVDEVVLMPWSQLAIEEEQTDQVLQHLAQTSMPVAVDGIVHVKFRPDAEAGMPYRVVSVAPGPGWVTENTRVRFRPAEGGWLDADVAGFEDVGGCVDEIRLLRELVELPLTRPQVYRELGISPARGIILHGPPGTGKTRLIHALAAEIDATFHYINGPEILGSMYGETESNLRRLFTEAVRKAPAMIFIDELDALAPQRSRTGSHSDARVVTQLLSLMDGIRDAEGVIVIATTNRLDEVDRACRRAGRFDRELFIGPPSEEGRVSILQVQTRAMPLSTSAIAALPDIARRAVGFVGADIKDLCREAALQTLRRGSSSSLASGGSGDSRADLVIEVDDFLSALESIEPAVMRSSYVLRPETAWRELEGRDELKADLLPIALSRLEASRRSATGSAPARAGNKGILLHGPTGAGKTAVAHALAERCGVAFLALNGGEVFSKWLGDSEAAVREVFAVAAQYAPSILLLDQLESIAAAGVGPSDPGGAARVLSQLQKDLDSLPEGVLVIGAAPHVTDVHGSITRRGRLGHHIAIRRHA